MRQKHLEYKDRVNLGSYYTPSGCVNLVWRMIGPYVDFDTVVIDSACGYGNFLKDVHQQIVNWMRFRRNRH